MSDLDAALPLPADATAALDDSAYALERVRAWTEGTCLASHRGLVPLLTTTWSGPASQAADAEAAAAGRHCADLAGSLAAPAAALRAYAAHVGAARRVVEGLRQEWERAQRLADLRVADPPGDDPVVAAAHALALRRSCERTQADLVARHTHCLAGLREQEARTAAVVRSATGPLGSPPVSARTLLADLPMTDGAIRSREALALVAGLLDGVPDDPARWEESVWSRMEGLGERAADPYLALALVERLGPAALAGAMSAQRWHPIDAAARRLGPLGTALVAVLSGAGVRDPVWRRRSDVLAEAVLASPRPDVADLVELMGHRTSQATPTPLATAALLRALLRDDPVHRDTSLIGGQDCPTGVPEPRPPADPVATLLDVAGRDLDGLRVVLLTDDGPGTPTLLHRLVVDRPIAQAATAQPLASSAVLGRELVALADDPHGGQAQQRLADEFLDDLGRAAAASWSAEPAAAVNIDRHRLPLGAAAAAYLVREPGRVAAALSAPLGTTAAERGMRVALLQGAIGEVGKASTLSAPATGPSPLDAVLAAVIGRDAEALARAGPTGEGASTDLRAASLTAAQRQAAAGLGERTGFVVGAASVSIAHAAASVDAVNQGKREMLDRVTVQITLPETVPAPVRQAAERMSDWALAAIGDQVKQGVPVDVAQRAAATTDLGRYDAANLLAVVAAAAVDSGTAATTAATPSPPADEARRISVAAISDGVRLAAPALRPAPAR